MTAILQMRLFVSGVFAAIAAVFLLLLVFIVLIIVVICLWRSDTDMVLDEVVWTVRVKSDVGLAPYHLFQSGLGWPAGWFVLGREKGPKFLFSVVSLGYGSELADFKKKVHVQN